jgi:hypothetical protein
MPRLRAPMPLFLALLMACSGDTAVDPPIVPVEPVATGLRTVSGDGQEAAAGAELPQPIVVQLVDQAGEPLAGVTVRFDITSGGGQLTATTAVTDAQGHASTRWRLGISTAAEQRVQARVDGSSAPGLTREFHAIPRAGSPARVVVAAGDDQSAVAGTALPTPLAVRVEDEHGNPVPGVAVAWTSSAGGVLAPLTTITDATGRVLRRQAGSGSVTSFTVAANATTFTDTGLPSDTTFYYRIVPVLDTPCSPEAAALCPRLGAASSEVSELVK